MGKGRVGSEAGRGAGCGHSPQTLALPKRKPPEVDMIRLEFGKGPSRFGWIFEGDKGRLREMN